MVKYLLCTLFFSNLLIASPRFIEEERSSQEEIPYIEILLENIYFKLESIEKECRRQTEMHDEILQMKRPIIYEQFGINQPVCEIP